MASVRNLSRGASSLAVVAAMGVLAGCNQGAAPTNAATAPAPLSSLALSNAAQPIAPAPGADALPPAPPATLGSLANSGQRYAFADRAAAMNSGFGDAPPDYTFNYGGEQPWVWRGDDQSMRVAEPLADGSYRYYYYEPGAQTPYLVRDHDRSYGYDNGALVVVYDAGGDAAAPDADEADIAGRFLARARDLDAATQRAQRQAVAQANWQARQQAIDAEDAQWQSDQASNPDWRDYHQTQAQQDDAYWAAERYRREAEAARYAEQANDAQQAARDWQAAQAAQQLVTTVLQQRGAGGPPPGYPGSQPGPGPQGAAPQGRAPPFAQSGPGGPPPQPPAGAPNGLQGQHVAGGPPAGLPPGAPPHGPGGQTASNGQAAAAAATAQAAAQRQAELEASTRQAQAQATDAERMHVQAVAAQQAQLQALAAQRAQSQAAAVETARAGAAAAAAHEAQLHAAGAAQAQAQAEAARQAELRLAAARQAQIQAQAQAQAAAAQQARLAAAARLAQQQAAATQAQAAARRQAALAAAHPHPLPDHRAATNSLLSK